MVVPVTLPKDNLKSESAPPVGPEERGTMPKPANTLKKENVSTLKNENVTNAQKKKGSKKKQNVNEEVRERKKKGLTPYQGDRRACGMFQCYDCNKYWFSANSWADCYQKCKGCNRKIYPYRQFPPERSEGPRREAPPHPRDMCQKCIQLRGSCVGRPADTTRGGDYSFEREE